MTPRKAKQPKKLQNKKAFGQPILPPPKPQMRLAWLLLFLCACDAGAASGPDVPVSHYGDVVCSGVLLSGSAVLTAAHCLEHGRLSVLGIDTEKVVRHPTQDIAVLKLSRRIVGTPVDFAEAPATVKSDVVAMGYGRPFLGDLHETDMTVERLAPRGIVLIPGPEIVCNGDSGSPLYMDGALVGVVVRSDCQTIAVAERIDYVQDFLAEFRK